MGLFSIESDPIGFSGLNFVCNKNIASRNAGTLSTEATISKPIAHSGPVNVLAAVKNVPSTIMRPVSHAANSCIGLVTFSTGISWLPFILLFCANYSSQANSP